MSSTSSEAPLLGYCHVCDRQVNINRADFNCSQCNSGFVELFEADPAAAGHQTRADNAAGLTLDDVTEGQATGGMNDLLPLLFPQLLNFQNIVASSAAGGSGAASSAHQPMPASFFMNNPMFEAQTGQPNARHGGSTTRFQVIVPNRSGPNEAGGHAEQFDLYGIINSVISDLLDPRQRNGSPTAAASPNSTSQPHAFHFQAPPIRMFQLHGDLRDYAWGTNGLDSIITQLLNQLENTGPPPASEDQLKNLPEVNISQDQIDSNVQCAICMEDFNLNEKARKLPCKHMFHQPCIFEWLKLHGTCPVCRKNLNGEDTSQREYISRPPAPTTSTTTPVNSSSSTSPAAESTTSHPATATPAGSDSSATASNQANSDNNNRNSSNNFYYDPEFD